MQNKISLFVMQGCQLCPQMEHLFYSMQENGEISELEVFDVSLHPELAEKHNIRSVPFYLINDVAFSGIKSRQDINQLLQQDDTQKWLTRIKDELTSGQLDEVEEGIRQHETAREAMIQLLYSDDTELVVRIGLTAVIETLASGSVLLPYESRFVEMAHHQDERIAVDALYYLSLLDSPSSLKVLIDMSEHSNSFLSQHARELLDESSGDQVLH